MSAPPTGPHFTAEYLAANKGPRILAIIIVFPVLALIVVLFVCTREFLVSRVQCVKAFVSNGMGRHIQAVTFDQLVASMKFFHSSTETPIAEASEDQHYGDSWLGWHYWPSAFLSSFGPRRNATEPEHTTRGQYYNMEGSIMARKTITIQGVRNVEMGDAAQPDCLSSHTENFEIRSATPESQRGLSTIPRF
ncbi:hypothetical protein BKA66DRAFT_438466 [Pyrenochaeta sp. MPI-SDFR-AT-0127]|nr:hypothetical protein BKA66DRAFT_438466 [Pyrenochaeta sp. MPI-SDFR-AT-0127]